MLNHVTLMGRLTRDPELRHTQAGKAVASFTLAVDRDYRPQQQTDFIDVVAWSGTAEFVSRYFFKGQLAAVTGRIQIRDWTDSNNNRRKATEVVADHIYFCGKENSAASVPSEPQDLSELLEDDEDLPF